MKSRHKRARRQRRRARRAGLDAFVDAVRHLHATTKAVVVTYDELTEFVQMTAKRGIEAGQLVASADVTP